MVKKVSMWKSEEGQLAHGPSVSPPMVGAINDYKITFDMKIWYISIQMFQFCPIWGKFRRDDFLAWIQKWLMLIVNTCRMKAPIIFGE